MFVSSQSAIFLIFICYSSIFNRCASAVNGTNYCNITSCEGKPHTMCTYTQSKPSSNCHNYIAAPLTVDETSVLVKRHNELRKKVADGKETRGAPGPQPPASNMMEMTWDEELAQIAQRWADQCMSDHDECRDSERFAVGQNIAYQWDSGKVNITVEELVDRWYNEVEYFSRNLVAQFRYSSSYGHYTQLVWGNTSRLGCGVVRYFDRKRNSNAIQLVCNYGPVGNYVNQPVYKEGTAGSACPSGVSKNGSSLCT